MQLFPAFFQMDGAQIVIFGDGVNAERKARLVAKTPAQIALVSRHMPDWAKAVEQITHVEPEQAGQALDMSRFAIIASEDETELQWAYELVRAFGVPVNVGEAIGA